MISPFMARLYLKLLRNIAKFYKSTGGKYHTLPWRIDRQKQMAGSMARRYYRIKSKGHEGLRGWGKNPPYISAENILKKKAEKIVKRGKNFKPNKDDTTFLFREEAWHSGFGDPKGKAFLDSLFPIDKIIKKKLPWE